MTLLHQKCLKKQNHPQLRSSEKCTNYRSHRQEKYHAALCTEVFCDIVSRNRLWITEKLREYHWSSSTTVHVQTIHFSEQKNII